MSDTAVIAVEPNEESSIIFKAGNYVANTLGLNTEIVSVVEPIVEMYADFNFTPLADINQDYISSSTAYRTNHMQDLISEAGSSAEAHVLIGRPAHEIVEHAKSRNARMVAMGAHNRSGLGRLLGSTAHAVLSHWHGNFLAVHPDEEQHPYERVLVAVDTTPMLGRVLEEAKNVSEASADRRVLSVSMPFSTLFAAPLPPDATGVHFSYTEVENDLVDQARVAINEAAQAAGYSADNIDVLQGGPADTIVDMATQWNADLIVMGASNRSAVNRILLGSTARAVLNHSPCDVYLVGDS